MAKPSRKFSRHERNRPRIAQVLSLAPNAATGDSYDLLVYGDIGESWWSDSVTAKAVVEQLNALDANVTTINVRINSYGGSVADGLAIYNALKRHPAHKAVSVDGVAMSSASLIAMAGDTRAIPPTSLLMIHAPWGGIAGNAKEMRQYADILDKFSESMADAYVEASGQSRDEILALLTDGEDHYYTGEEAVAAGFATSSPAASGDEDHEPDEAARAFANRLLARITGRGTSARHTGLVVAAALRGLPNVPPPFNQSPAPGQSENTMPNPTNDVSAALAADQTRRQAIRASFAPFQGRADLNQTEIADLLRSCEDNHAMTPEAAGQKLLALLGRDAAPLASGFEPATARHAPSHGSDFVLAATDALLLRGGIHVDKPHAGASDVAPLGLHGIIRACAQRSGRYTGGNIAEAIRAALSTSDFPAILENSLGKTLRTGYESEPQTYTRWTRLTTVPDFKEQSRVILGSAPELKQVLEGAEYEYGGLEEDKASYAVTKWGRMIRLTWEALVNDDLGAFLRTTQAMGIAAARAEADLIYATFAANSGAGPQMQDGVNLFHADHGNLAASSAALDAAALGKARILLRRQTALGGGTMNLPPRFLLVAPEHEQAAEVLLAASARAMNQGSGNELVTDWISKLELVVEARLAGAAAYLLTSPQSVDTLERAWLEADNGPVVRENESFAVDSRDYKVRHVFGARWLDWRGVVKLPISS